MPEITPQLLAIVAGGLFGAIGYLLLVKLNFKWTIVVLAAMVFFAALGTAYDFYDMPYRTWIAPLSDNRSLFYSICGVGMVVVLGMEAHRVRIRDVTPTAWLAFILSLWGGFIQCFHDGFSEGLKSLLFAGTTLFPLALLTGAMVRNWGDWMPVFRAVGFALAVWTFVSAVQFVLDRRLVTLGNENRFIGVSANPQHTSAWLACSGAIVIYLALADPVKILRIMWMGLTGVMLVMLAWTGSRTGAGMLLVASGLMLYSRLGRVILLLPFAGLAIFGLSKVLSYDYGGLNTDRLLSTDDTRSVAWITLIDGFIESPIIGVGSGRLDASENGYLLGASTYGVGFVFLQFLVTLAAMIQCAKLWLLRSSLPPRDRVVVDVIIGTIASFFAGSVLEGYFAARISVNIVMLAMASVVGGRLVAIFNEAQNSVEPVLEEVSELHEYQDHTAPISS
jgi:hypothetical protein